MKILVKWIKNYARISCSIDEFVYKMTMVGFEVAHVDYCAKDFKKIITGKIVEINKHPNANKFFICQIDIGGKILQITTGADNITINSIVPVALSGAKLPNRGKIKKTTFRGIQSFGMLCSIQELAIEDKFLPPKNCKDIFVLPDETKIGVPIAQALEIEDDSVIDFEVAPNRPDCFSVLGLAREAAMAYDIDLIEPSYLCVNKLKEKTQEFIKVKVKNDELVTRFIGKVIKNVKIKESPQSIKKMLQSVGIIPINNIIDIVNYITLELGQPIHAYDLDKICGNEIIVRTAEKNEFIVTIDNIKKILETDTIVTTDSEKIISIAGITGSSETEVNANTKNIVLEAAAFNSSYIRRTSLKLGLKTESSEKFSKGVDIVRINLAIERAAQLIQNIEAGNACEGLIEHYPYTVKSKCIDFTENEINNKLGTEISGNEMLKILNKLGVRTQRKKQKIQALIPSWRTDIMLTADLAEEIGRAYGFDKIPFRIPISKTIPSKELPLNNFCDKIRNILSSLGMDETISSSFSSFQNLEKLRQTKNGLTMAVPIVNPINTEFSLMRTTLADSILNNIKYNLSRKNNDLMIYEIGKIYLSKKFPGQDLPIEKIMLCGAVCGLTIPPSWNVTKAEADFYSVKGVVEQILDSLRVNDYKFIIQENNLYHPGVSCSLVVNGKKIGLLGEVHPEILKNFDMNSKVYIFEVELEKLFTEVKNKLTYIDLPRFPQIERDISLYFKKSIVAGQILSFIKKKSGKLLKTANLFDVYNNKREDKKSLTFNLVYGSNERTLTDQEIDENIKDLLVALNKKFEANLRQ